MGNKNSTSIDYKYTGEDLSIMQSWSLDRKIQVTQTRIIEWYQKYNGQVYVSFSGGKDSTVLLHIARMLYPDIEAVFVDTGLEYPELREFVKTIPNVTWVKPEMNFKKVIQTYGYPLISKEIANKIAGAKPGTLRWEQMHGTAINPLTGKPSAYNCKKWEFLLDADFKISDRCCTIMKKKPALQYEKTSGKKPIIALMASESRKRKMDYMKTGCNAFDKKRPQSQPMGFWTDQDVYEYILKYDLKYASVYGDIYKDENGVLKTTGCNRSGCIFCLFGIHLEKEPNRLQQLKITHPKLWNYCIKSWDDGGLDLKKVLEYIGVKYE